MMRRYLALSAALALVAAGGARAQEPVTVRHWAYPSYTRVVFELAKVAEPTIRYLPEDREAERTERLYFDLEQRGARAFALEVGDGVVRGIRAGRNRPNRARVVLDLDRYVKHRVLSLGDPPRLILDVFGAEEAGTTNGAPKEPERIVVVDPGHGGRDPGAIGIGRRKEKDVTLAVSQELRRELQERGFRVIMTREDDRWLSLEERTAIAEGHGAALFVSVHANAAPNKRAHGIETYYLDRASRRQTLRVAAHENGTTPARLDALQKTLASLRVSEAAQVSSGLATNLHETLVHGMGVSAGSVTDLGVKRGPFQVLFLTQIPAVLVEVGFLTHPGESKRLANPDYRRALGVHLARGVERYWARREVRIAKGE
ncbi:MAG: N-acetylmuramoyl-L-alanine amidase [Myxococcales bacterium]|nr:N-acetylmuramoyl-L-alanine amidase [Myxococcales bacterium]